MVIEKNPEIKKAYAIVKELSESEQTILLEEAIEKQRRDEASRIKGAYKRGVEEGEKKRNLDIIKNAYQQKMEIKNIASILQMSDKEVRDIITKNNY